MVELPRWGDSVPEASAQVRQRLEKELIKLPNIVGVSHENPRDRIILYVESEQDAMAMPRSLAGVPVEVRVIGKVVALQPEVSQLSAGVHTQKTRPLIGGVSVFACCERAAGTLGMITYDGKILSNAHVLAINPFGGFYPIGQKIVQPAPLDGGSEQDEVGWLHSYVPIKFNDAGAENYVDAAVAMPTVEVEKGIIEGIGKVEGWSEPGVGMKVRKSGRSTGVTESVILDTGATIKVTGYPQGWAVFKDVFLCRAFARGGDSGSVIVSENNRVVGLLFAGSNIVTIGCNIKHVIDKLNVALGTKDVEKVQPKMEMLAPAMVPVGFVGGSIILEEVRKMFESMWKR